MSLSKHDTKLPKITVTETERSKLMRLAQAAETRMPEVADALLSELERAKVQSAGKIGPGVVRMHSRVAFVYDDGAKRTATLVYPEEANIAEGRISVLTPIGAALIGLSQGQSIPWVGPDGREHRLTVLHVDPPEDVPPG
ncbi:nucleoside diphosphate kinase regulator [Microvirga pudoricolor]|uniref:nucleoside diphosphate kinase regulator n=1 Tax=Microvirga pudoricolor TaxID=2778729 RepID=UPI001951FA36|nr:nucleoside diphosphate kinase regulator [Microvirga pudoricolor]MBM6594457.1 nucleoside diphosphate kinase regulator [Microvirga pudoricolor]